MLNAADGWQKMRMSLWTQQHGGHQVPDSSTFHEVRKESLIRVGSRETED